MSTSTTHYGLVKPTGTEKVLRTVINDNSDKTDAALYENSVLKGAMNPTTATVGKVGQFYFNTTSGASYQCVAISGSTYTWKALLNDRIGQITNYMGSTMDTDHALCNGSVFGAAEYPELATVLGRKSPQSSWISKTISINGVGYAVYKLIYSTTFAKYFALSKNLQTGYVSILWTTNPKTNVWSALQIAALSYVPRDLIEYQGYLVALCTDDNYRGYIYYSNAPTYPWSQNPNYIDGYNASYPTMLATDGTYLVAGLRKTISYFTSVNATPVSVVPTPDTGYNSINSILYDSVSSKWAVVGFNDGPSSKTQYIYYASTPTGTFTAYTGMSFDASQRCTTFCKVGSYYVVRIGPYFYFGESLLGSYAQGSVTSLFYDSPYCFGYDGDSGHYFHIGSDNKIYYGTLVYGNSLANSNTAVTASQIVNLQNADGGETIVFGEGSQTYYYLPAYSLPVSSPSAGYDFIRVR